MQRNGRGSLRVPLAGFGLMALLLLGPRLLSAAVPLGDGDAASSDLAILPWMLAGLLLFLILGLVGRKVVALLRARAALAQQRCQIEHQSRLLSSRLAQEQQAREFVGHFLHELGGLAIGAKGILAVLPSLAPFPSGPVSPDQHQFVDRSSREHELSSALKETIDEMDLLLGDLSILLRQGCLPALQRQRIEVSTLLQQVRQLALSAHPTIDVRVAVSPPDLVICGDVALLRRALLTAMRNAKQAIMSELFCSERPWIILRGLLDNGSVVLRIEDSGPGFSPALLHKMSALVTRPADALPSGWFSDKAGGSGRGLPLIDQVARLHQGTFSLGNAPNNSGAWVELQVPVQGVTRTMAAAIGRR